MLINVLYHTLYVADFGAQNMRRELVLSPYPYPGRVSRPALHTDAEGRETRC